MGIVAISLTGYAVDEKKRGKDNKILATTDVVFADGSTIKAADVLFVYDGKDHGPSYSSAPFSALEFDVYAGGPRHALAGVWPEVV
jgi:hypothetical protein